MRAHTPIDLRFHADAFDETGSFGITAAELRAGASAMEQRECLLDALRQLANCDLHEGNCASLEVATKRIRNIARAAIRKATGESA